MSIVAVEKKKNRITFAWDSQTTYYGSEAHQDKNKVKVFGNLIFGFVGIVSSRHYIHNFLNELANMGADIRFHNSFDVIRLFDEYRSRYEHLDHVSFQKEDNTIISDGKKVFVYHPSKSDCYEVKGFEALGSGA